jgi:hypothetical protein
VIRFRRVHVATFTCGLMLALSWSVPAQAQGKAKSTQTEAEFLKFDAATSTITVKVKDPGKGPNARQLKRSQEVVFNVKPEGSVLTRTSVAVNGVKGELKEIPPGKQINVYWVPDVHKKGELFARKVDVVLSDEELEARYGYEK